MLASSEVSRDAAIVALSSAEATLQLVELAVEALEIARDTRTPPITRDCAALPVAPTGSGTLDVDLVDAAQDGPTAGDELRATFRQCASVAVNDVVDGTLVIRLEPPIAPGPGSPIARYRGTLDATGLAIGGGTAGNLAGSLQFEHRRSLEHDLLAASTGDAGFKLRISDGGDQVEVAIRQAEFRRDADFTTTRALVNLSAQFTLTSGGDAVRFSMAQRTPFESRVGNAPLTGELVLSGGNSTTATFTGYGDLSMTGLLRMTVSAPPGGTLEYPWTDFVEGFLWWDPGRRFSPTVDGYIFGNRFDVPLAFVRSVPGDGGSTASPVAIVVYLNRPVTEASAASAQIAPLGNPGLGQPADVAWQGGMIILRPRAALAPGEYEASSTASLVAEGGPPFPSPVGYRVRFTVE